MERFLLSLHRQKISPFNEGMLLLKAFKDGNFFVKAMYKRLDISSDIDFPYSSVWNSVVPPKIGFFFT